MLIENDIAVDATPDDVYALMLDVERVAPCIPGAQVTGRREDLQRVAKLVVAVDVTRLGQFTDLPIRPYDKDGIEVRGVMVDPATTRVECNRRSPTSAASASRCGTTTRYARWRCWIGWRTKRNEVGIARGNREWGRCSARASSPFVVPRARIRSTADGARR